MSKHVPTSTVDYSMERYRSVWTHIASEASDKKISPTLWSLIMKEAMEDLKTSRKTPSMDASQQQFWVERYMWESISPETRFPGDLSLQEEIYGLQLARRMQICMNVGGAENSNTCDPEIKVEFQTSETCATEALQYSVQATDTIEAQNIVNASSKTDSHSIDAKLIEKQFYKCFIERRMMDFGVDLSYDRTQFLAALSSLKKIDAVDHRGRSLFSIYFEADQDIIDAFHCYQTTREGVESVEKVLGVKFRCRFERRKLQGEWVKEYLICARPINVLDALHHPSALKCRLKKAYQFLAYWKFLVGKEVRQDRGKERLLTSLLQAYDKWESEGQSESEEILPKIKSEERPSTKSKGQERPNSKSTTTPKHANRPPIVKRESPDQAVDKPTQPFDSSDRSYLEASIASVPSMATLVDDTLHVQTLSRKRKREDSPILQELISNIPVHGSESFASLALEGLSLDDSTSQTASNVQCLQLAQSACKRRRELSPAAQSTTERLPLLTTQLNLPNHINGDRITKNLATVERVSDVTVCRKRKRESSPHQAERKCAKFNYSLALHLGFYGTLQTTVTRKRK